ncbi:MAG: aspartyl/glutamyl-tRNA amidotransferase subunit C [Parcubacteria group bacterium]
MALTISEIDHLAKLTRISLTDEEKELFCTQLDSILEYAGHIREVHDNTSVSPHSSKSLEDISESDSIVQFSDADGLVASVPKRSGRSIEVPPVKDAT